MNERRPGKPGRFFGIYGGKIDALQARSRDEGNVFAFESKMLEIRDDRVLDLQKASFLISALIPHQFRKVYGVHFVD